MNRFKKPVSANHAMNHLFSGNKNYQPKEPKETKKQPQKRLNIYVNAYQISSKIIYNEPIITTNDYKQTMKNYRLHFNNYNKKVDLDNIAINKYNLKVSNYHKEHKLTLSNFLFIEEFQKDHRPKLKRDYNEKVEIINLQYGYLLFKKKIQRLRLTSERIFETLLYFYQSQIRTKNAKLKAQFQPTVRVLTKLILNHRNVQLHKRDGIRRLGNITKQTVRNHIKYLKESGVLINPINRGNRKPIRIEFNPKILVVSDQIPNFSKTTQNQLVNNTLHKKVAYYKDTNYVKTKNKDKNKKKADLLLCLADSLPNYQSVSNPKNSTIEEKKKKVAPKKKKNENLSKTLKFQLQTPNELAKSLEVHNPISSIIDPKILEYEKDYGFLNREDYTKLIVQNIMLIAYHFLYKNHKNYNLIYEGVYKKTMNLLIERFKNKGFFLRKNVMYNTYLTYKKALEMANFKFAEVDYKDVLLPFDYFDPNRTDSLERGFQYILNKTRKAQKKQENNNREIDVLRKKAKKRKKNLRYNKMFSNALTRYYKGILTRDEFYNYVITSLPNRFMDRYLISVNN